MKLNKAQGESREEREKRGREAGRGEKRKVMGGDAKCMMGERVLQDGLNLIWQTDEKMGR